MLVMGEVRGPYGVFLRGGLQGRMWMERTNKVQLHQYGAAEWHGLPCTAAQRRHGHRFAHCHEHCNMQSMK
ncbi:hypothetical protein C3F36_20925 [Aeromonas sp. ASNIH2]|nr:hypothetical protein C3F36_20925 [Aeromonas sp. ASNIH2]